MTKDLFLTPAHGTSEILRRLAFHKDTELKRIRDATVKNTEVRDPEIDQRLNVEDIEANENHPIEFACEWLERHTGESRNRIYELAGRLTTAGGPEGYTTGGRSVHNEETGEYEISAIKEKADLLPVVKSLGTLDSLGTTRLLIQELVQRFPKICSALRIENLWYNDGPPPTGWGHPDPIDGTKKQIAEWLGCSTDGLESMANLRTSIWIWKRSGQQWSIFFKTKGQYEKVARARDQEQTAKTTNTPKEGKSG